MKTRSIRARSAFTLIEVLIATTLGTFAMAAVVSGAYAIQRCFVAAEDFARGKADQIRLSDFLALDLRRAITITPGSDGITLITLKIPNYYDNSGQPRTPTITNYVASYGDPAVPVTVVYKKQNGSIYRSENNGTQREIAASVEDFQLSVQDLGKVVKTQVTFLPTFRRKANLDSRAATTVFNTTLLRNKRR